MINRYTNLRLLLILKKLDLTQQKQTTQEQKDKNTHKSSGVQMLSTEGEGGDSIRQVYVVQQKDVIIRYSLPLYVACYQTDTT